MQGHTKEYDRTILRNRLSLTVCSFLPLISSININSACASVVIWFFSFSLTPCTLSFSLLSFQPPSPLLAGSLPPLCPMGAAALQEQEDPAVRPSHPKLSIDKLLPQPGPRKTWESENGRDFFHKNLMTLWDAWDVHGIAAPESGLMLNGFNSKK